jgi:hypothetical protein
MPRPSFDPEKAKQGGGVEAGIYEVTAAKFQNLKSDFKATQPHLVLIAAQCDKEGDRVRGAEDVEIHFGLGEKSAQAFHVGQGAGPEDNNPNDMGDGVDAEGNTIYCEGSEQFQRSCAAMVFGDSLKKLGFPVAVLDRCYAPDFAGLKFELATLTSKECNEKLGTRLNTRPLKDKETGADRPVTYKVAVRWLNPNYLAGGTAAQQAAPAAGDTSNATPEDLAKKLVGLIAAARPGAKNQIKSAQALFGFATNIYAKSKMPGQHLATVQGLMKNADWITQAIAELGGVCAYDDAGKWTGAVTFPG